MRPSFAFHILLLRSGLRIPIPNTDKELVSTPAVIKEFEQHLGRRKHPRREFERVVGILIAGHYSLSTGFEIGEGGIAFYLSDKLEPGAKGVISLQIPKGAFVSLIFEVRSLIVDENKQLFRIGCLFQNIPFESKREIRAYVSARA